MISQAALRAYRERRFNSFGWMKKLTEAELWAEIGKLPIQPTFRSKPWLHQLVCWWLGYCYPEFLFLLDMGTGKTWILLNLIEQRLREGKDLRRRPLVCVPRRVNMSSWLTAAEEHSHLEPWTVDVTDIDEKWERLVQPKGDFTLIDYPGLHLACTEKVTRKKGKNKLRLDRKKLDALRAKYSVVCMDESHLTGNPESLWFDILRYLTADAEAVYSATGTLFGKKLESVWAQFYLVDQGKTFGENMHLFRETFYTAKQHEWKGQELIVNRDRGPLLHKMVGHRSLRYEDVEVHDLPRCVPRKRIVSMGPEQTEHYLRALEGLINAEGSVQEMEARWLRMRQITSGYLAWKDETGDHLVYLNDNPKLEELDLIIEEAGDQRLVISYEYTPTGAHIADLLTQRGISYEWLYGGTKDSTATIERFKRPEGARVFLMNSAAGGTGVDGLQKWARYLIFAETPSSPTARQQTLKRIYRAGQEYRTFVYDIVAARTLDVGILADLADGRDFFESVMTGKAKKGALLGGTV